MFILLLEDKRFSKTKNGQGRALSAKLDVSLARDWLLRDSGDGTVRSAWVQVGLVVDGAQVTVALDGFRQRNNPDRVGIAAGMSRTNLAFDAIKKLSGDTEMLANLARYAILGLVLASGAAFLPPVGLRANDCEGGDPAAYDVDEDGYTTCGGDCPSGVAACRVEPNGARL